MKATVPGVVSVRKMTHESSWSVEDRVIDKLPERKTRRLLNHSVIVPNVSIVEQIKIRVKQKLHKPPEERVHNRRKLQWIWNMINTIKHSNLSCLIAFNLLYTISRINNRVFFSQNLNLFYWQYQIYVLHIISNKSIQFSTCTKVNSCS